MTSDAIAVSRQGNLVVINHTNFEIKFNLSKGTWDYSDAHRATIIRDGCSQVTLEDGNVVKTEDAGSREFVTESPKTDNLGSYHRIRFSHEAADKGLRINTYLKCYAEHPSIHLTLGVENLKSEPVQLRSVTVLGISERRGAVLSGGAPSDYHLFINMPPVSPGVNKRLYEGFLLSDTDVRHPINDGVLHDTKNGKSLVFGFLTSERWWPRVQVGCQASSGRGSQSQGKQPSGSGVNRWSLYHDCQQRCGSGEEIVSETAYINFIGEAAGAYEHYTATVARSNAADARVPGETASKTPIAAWSLSGLPEVSELDSLLAEVDALAANPLFRPDYPGGVCYIQCDGSRVSEGSALSKPLQAFAPEVRAKGFKAGIQFNPFCVALESELVKSHPEYFIQQQNASGGRRRYGRGQGRRALKPATVHLPESGREVVLLDVSHPEVRSRIQEQVSQMVGTYGYSLLNVDFTAYTIGLTNATANLSWYDNDLTAVQLYDLAGTLLRDAIEAAKGENTLSAADVRLAGYNAVPGPCIGLLDMNSPLLDASVMDSSRESDSWHHQRGTKHRLSRYAAHLRELNVLWGHVFGAVGVDEPRPINEVIVALTAAALSGGTVLCTDKWATLASVRAEYLSKIFPLTGQAATPLDLYDESFPGIWSLPISTPRETWYLAAVFNWNDYEDDAHFDLEALGFPTAKEFLVHDFWMRQYLGTVSQRVTLLNIPPRSAKLLCFREEQDVPQLLATDMHYTQGGVEILSAGWDAHSQSYLLVCNPMKQAEGTCFIHVPEGYLPISAATYGSDYQYSWDKPICKLTFTETDPDQLVHASIHFARTSGGNG